MGVGGIGSIGNIAVRILLIVSAAVIIGLSVYLRDQFDYLHRVCDAARLVDEDTAGDCGLLNMWVMASRYGIFVGVWGLVTAFLGFLPTFIASSIVFIVAAVYDALATLFYVAGGITFTVLYRKLGGDRTCEDSTYSACTTIQTRIQADMAFMWIGFILSIFALVALFFVRRSQ